MNHLEAKQELEKVNQRATSVINNLPFIVPEFILSSTRTNIGLEKDFFSSGNFGLQQLRIIYASSGDEGVKALVSECLNGKNFASQSYSYIESTEWSEDTKNGLKEILKLKNFGITVNDGQKPPQ